MKRSDLLKGIAAAPALAASAILVKPAPEAPPAEPRVVFEEKPRWVIVHEARLVSQSVSWGDDSAVSDERWTMPSWHEVGTYCPVCDHETGIPGPAFTYPTALKPRRG